MNRAPIVLTVSGLNSAARQQLQSRLGLKGSGYVMVPGTSGSARAKTLIAACARAAISPA